MLTLMVAAMCLVGDPVQDIADLRADVVAVVAAGELATSYGNVLNNFLVNATRRLEQGLPTHAVSLLRSFKAYTTKYVNAGKLSAAHGQNFIDQADAIILELLN